MFKIHYTAVNAKTGQVMESENLNFLIDLIDFENFLDYIEFGVEYKITDWIFKTELREV